MYLPLVATSALLCRMYSTSKSHQFGQWGEKIALLFLEAHGYQTLAVRYRTPYGEIDIITKKENLLVFVEVKTRKSYAAMATALTSHQHQRATQAAEHFLSTYPCSDLFDIRFDAIMVNQNGIFNHIEGIWEASSE